MKALFQWFVYSGILGLSVWGENYEYGLLPIGGGGANPGLIIHPAAENTLYLRTDVGTPYRWNAAETRWQGLLYGVSDSRWWLKSVSSFAIDPSDASGLVVYAIAGIYPDGTWGAGKSQCLKSMDGGMNWQTLNLNVNSASNFDQLAGERIVVDPADGNLVYVTSRSDGTWINVHAGDGEWSRITDKNGNFVICGNPLQMQGQIGSELFIGVRSEGIYRSRDGGLSWALLEGGPSNPNRAVWHSDGILFVTHDNGIMRWDGSSWLELRPASGKYVGLAVNPANVQELVTAPNGWNQPLYRSKDGGKNWSRISYKLNKSEAPWMPEGYAASSVFDVKWDPRHPSRVWFTDWYHPYETEDIWAENVVFTIRSIGHENIVTTGTMLAPMSADYVLHSSIADVGGFDHGSMLRPPSAAFYEGSTGYFVSTGIDTAAKHPLLLARVGRYHWDGAGRGVISRDGGLHYQPMKSVPGDGGRVAVSADGASMLWATQSNRVACSQDFGDSWTTSNGVPQDIMGGQHVFVHTQPIDSDKVDAATFYAYYAGSVYLSKDGGKTFELVYGSLPVLGSESFASLRATPGYGGDLWASLDGQGLFHSADRAKSFVKIGSVNSSKLFAIGKSAPDRNYPSLFVYGKVSGVEGVFRSDDKGENWIRIDSDHFRMVDGLDMAADPRVFGRVFIGSGGNGVYYAQPDPSTLIPVLGVADSLPYSLMPLYRFYRSDIDSYFFTANVDEKASLERPDSVWVFQGASHQVIQNHTQAAVPVYRLYNLKSGTHFYTANRDELMSVLRNMAHRFRFEGIAFYAMASPEPGALPVYRFFSTRTGSHFFTVDEVEKANFIATPTWGDFHYEGVAWYAFP